jgi:CHASE3 domain sensor protein
MKLVVMAVALLGLALGAAACDSGDDSRNPRRDELTLGDYLSEIEDLQNDAQSRFDELDLDLDPSASVDESKERFSEFFDELRAVIEDFVEGLQDLEPPEEAEELHADAVEASNDFLDALDESIEQIEDLDSLADLLGLEAPEFDEATERFDQVCAELQQLADDNEIEADLGCE